MWYLPVTGYWRFWMKWWFWWYLVSTSFWVLHCTSFSWVFVGQDFLLGVQKFMHKLVRLVEVVGDVGEVRGGEEGGIPGASSSKMQQTLYATQWQHLFSAKC